MHRDYKNWCILGWAIHEKQRVSILMTSSVFIQICPVDRSTYISLSIKRRTHTACWSFQNKMKHDYYYAICKCLFIDADKVYISNGNLDVSTIYINGYHHSSW